MSAINISSDPVTLGRKVSDKITGFEGIVTGLCEYISGCHQALVAPFCKPDGEFREPHWFDVDRLSVDSDPAIKLTVEAPGPDKAAPKR